MPILGVELTSKRSKCRTNVYKYKLEPIATTVVELMTRSHYHYYTLLIHSTIYCIVNSTRYILHLGLYSCSTQSYYPLFTLTDFLVRNFSTCATLCQLSLCTATIYDGTHWFIVAHAAYFQTGN